MDDFGNFYYPDENQWIASIATYGFVTDEDSREAFPAQVWGD